MTEEAPTPERGTPVGRRVLLGLLGFGAVGIVTGDRVSRFLSTTLAPIENADPTGLLSLLPLGSTFRYYSVTGSAPSRDAASYRLTIGGMVTTPTTLTMPALQAMPQTAVTRDFQCVTGWRVPEVPWTGVQLSHLLDAAGVMPGATAVRFTSFDGTYTESLTMAQARLPDVLVALGMQGGAVSHSHGGPVRLFVGPMYGYKSLKWLGGIEVTKDVVPGYWEHRGYDIDGFVGTSNGRGDDPTT